MAAIDRRAIWIVAILVTTGLLIAFLFITDRAAIVALAGKVSWLGVILGLLLLQAEGIATALRVSRLVFGVTFLDCLSVVGRWVAALTVLPARLGEIWGLHLMVRRLAEPLGRSINHLFVQRLFDVLVLTTFGLPVIALADAGLARTHALAGLLVVVLLLTLILLRLPACFSLLAKVGYVVRHRRPGRHLLRGSPHARRAARRTLLGHQPFALGAISVLKCVCNVGGVSALIVAFVPEIPVASAAGLAILCSLAAVIPLSGVGGIGIGDITLTVGLVWRGIDPATAAAVALGVRLSVFIAPLIFCFGVLVIEAIFMRGLSVPIVLAADAR